MKRVILLSLVLLLTGCAAGSAQTQSVNNHQMPVTSFSSGQYEHIEDEPQVFVQVHNYAIGVESKLERESLYQLSTIIRQAYDLSVAAQETSNDLSRIKFDYATLQLDLQAIAFGLSQYLQTDFREIRFPTQNNARPIVGDYMKVRN